MKSPAYIIRRLLLSQTTPEITAPSEKKTWPCYVGHMPDLDGTPSEVACVYDIPAGVEDRLMSGEVIEKPLVQVKVRSENYETAYGKAAALAAVLDATVRTVVTDTSESWTVHNASRITTLMNIGNETGRKRYNFFVFDVRVTLTR